MLLLGLCTANYAILFFLVGFLILIPALVGGLNMLAEWVVWEPCKMSFQDVCSLVIPFYGDAPDTLPNRSDPKTHEYIVLTPWMTMMAFFLGYILQNAAILYTRESSEAPIDEMVIVDTPNDVKGKTVTRKTQAVISLVTIISFILIVLKYRYDTGCEGALRMLGASVVGGLLGVGWYSLLRETGQDRLSDLFGIANRLLPPGALANKPLACLPESCM